MTRKIPAPGMLLCSLKDESAIERSDLCGGVRVAVHRGDRMSRATQISVPFRLSVMTLECQHISKVSIILQVSVSA